MLGNALAKFRRKYREVGLRYASFILLKSVLPTRILAFNVFVFVDRPIERFQEASDPDILFRPVTVEDQAALSEFDEYADDVSQELAKGMYGFVLEKQGEIVASDWYAMREFGLFGWAVVRLPPDSIYSAFLSVRPSHRGHRYFQYVKERSLDTFARQGFARQFAVAEATNRNSLHAAEFGTGRTLTRIFYLRLFDWKLVRYKGAWRSGRWTKDSPLVLDV